MHREKKNDDQSLQSSESKFFSSVITKIRSRKEFMIYFLLHLRDLGRVSKRFEKNKQHNTDLVGMS